MTIVFIYAKDGQIKCLEHREAIENQQKLINDNWVHTATLDPCAYIQYLANCKNPIKEIEKLTTKCK